MLKPNAISERIVGNILQYFENAGMTIVDSKLLHFSREQAEEFYFEHKSQKFFEELVEYILSGPVIVQVLCGNDNIVELHREIIGATDPKMAKKGTVRGDLARSIDQNLVHGSDSEKSAKREIQMFFPHIKI